MIAWDSRKNLLRFGCGSGDYALTIDSNGKLEKEIWTNDSAAKLRSECVKRFKSNGAKVEGPGLLTRSEKFLRSYVHVRDERLYLLWAVWGIGTYLYPLFSHYGYMFVHSRFPRSGKTRLEEILSHLCFEATVPLNSPTIPTIRETAAEGRTVILDTLERWKGKNPEAHCAAMELLDAGFRNGGTVAKMVSAGDGNWKKEHFPVYAPYVLAAIDRESLTDTARDRSFVIEMHRKPITIKKQKYNFDRCEQECEPLRDDLYRWALENAALLAATYESAEMEAAVDALELNDRAADIWKPLLAVARVLGSAEVWQPLISLAIEMSRDPESEERERVRAIAQLLRKLVNGSGAAVGITSDFVSHLLTHGLEITERDLHDMLSQWGFSQESVRLAQGPRRAWELQDARLAEIERENGPISPS
ncbi:MAG: DUF3631 domain-containing protein [Candidatus Sulfotelmatobacter sp.]